MEDKLGQVEYQLASEIEELWAVLHTLKADEDAAYESSSDLEDCNVSVLHLFCTHNLFQQ